LVDPVIPESSLVMSLKADMINDLSNGAPVAKWGDASPNKLFAA